MKKAALHNLGCKVNSYETEAMQQLLEQAGYEIVPFHDRGGCLYYQYLFGDEHRGPQIQTDAPSGEENESGCSRGGSRLLCPDVNGAGKSGCSH